MSDNESESGSGPGTTDETTSDGTPQVAASSDYKVRGKKPAASGTGVLGHNTATSGTALGVDGVTDSATDGATGVRGVATATSGGVYGVLGVTDSRSGVGIVGAVSDSVPQIGMEGHPTGVWGHTDKSGAEGPVEAGYGVFGWSTATSGLTYGVAGRTKSPDGWGVFSVGDSKTTGDHEVGGAIRSPSGQSVTIDTDGGTRALELGVPGVDNAGHTTGANVVAGHPNNTVNNAALGVVIGGGGSGDTDRQNTGGGNFATVGGGQGNTASGKLSTISGGRTNTASDLGSTVGGGLDNTAHGADSAIGGGLDNRTGASGTDKGLYATIPGGQDNVAEGLASFAAGRDAHATHDGAFVLGDSSPDIITSSGSNEVRSQMPMFAPSFNSTSSRRKKSEIDEVDPDSVLAGVEALDITTWEFEHQDDGRHMGPMAEDFADSFGLGADDEHISTIDADGVALAAIQSLAEQLDEKDDRIEALEAETEELRGRNDDLEARLAAVEDHLGRDGASSQPSPADD